MADNDRIPTPDDRASQLEDFITTRLEEQETLVKDMDNLGSEKRNNFIERALSESRRMNKEIQLSRDKRDKLHAELGEERLKEWRDEHFAELQHDYGSQSRSHNSN